MQMHLDLMHVILLSLSSICHSHSVIAAWKEVPGAPSDHSSSSLNRSIIMNIGTCWWCMAHYCITVHPLHFR